jgi:phage terminase large subunit-like protein
MLSVAFALGRQHPDVQTWARGNGLDVSALPDRPGRVCASSLTVDMSRRVQRPALAHYLPAGTTWHQQAGEFRLPGGGVVICKSNDQGPRAYQGDSWDLFWPDEEHDEDVWNEGVMRLADRAGRGVLTMTPLKGLTWAYRRFVEAPETSSAVYQLHATDNPHVPAEYLRALLSKYGAHERAARERGEFLLLEGRVYEEFSRAIHVIDDQPIPADWPTIVVIDFGTRNPFCALWIALDPKDDVLHVFDEHYRAGWTIQQHAALLQGRRVPDLYIADPEDAGARLTLAREHGISTVPARKDVRAGVNAVAERLALDVVRRPHLLIHRRCLNTVNEIEGYRWAPRAGRERDAADAPLKANDHAMDALRYGAMHFRGAAVGEALPFAVGG